MSYLEAEAIFVNQFSVFLLIPCIVLQGFKSFIIKMSAI